MKKTLKFLIIGSLPFLFILYLTFLYSIIKSDWNYAHKSMYTYQDPFNWLEYKTKVSVVKSIINFRENSNLGLKTKRIYVEEQNQKKLLSDTPNSTKVWQDGFHYNQENKLKDMQVRFRGDNPRNWLFEKKNWRMKVRKKDVVKQKTKRLFFTACWTTTDGTGMTHSAANVPRAMGNPLGMKTDTTAAHAKPVAYFAAKNPMQSLVCCLLNPASNNTPTVIKTNGLFAFANGSANLCTTVGKLCPMILETKTTANAIKGGNFNMFKAFFFKVSSFNDSTFILAASARNVASLTVAVNSSMGTIFSNSFAFQMPALTTPLRLAPRRLRGVSDERERGP